MAETAKGYPPFGISTNRFNCIGIHPKFYKYGTCKQTSNDLGPGKYDPKTPECSKFAEPWKRKADTEEFSKFLGFRNGPILAERAFRKSHCGPGTYNIPDDYGKPKNFSNAEDVGFTRQKRFHKFTTHHCHTPNPGVYFSNIFARNPRDKKCFSTLPTFERDGLQDRFKVLEPAFRLSPTTYPVPEQGSVDALAKKICSLKGPYNLFTGPRDMTTIKNRFGTSNMKVSEEFYLPQSGLDYLLYNPKRRRYGKLSHTVRFGKRITNRLLMNDLTMCYKDPNEPGPSTYDLTAHLGIIQKDVRPYPFEISTLYVRPPIVWKIHPGTGRYNPKDSKCSQNKRPTCVFLSKVDRNFFKKQDKYTDFD